MLPLVWCVKIPLRLAQSKTRPMGGGSVWSDRIRANDAGRGGWGDQWSQGSTHGVRAVQGSQGHPTTRRHTRDLNPRRNPTSCAQCQNRQRSGWRSRENAQGRRARHCLTRRWPWCTRTRTRTLPAGAVTWVVCPLGPPAYVDSSTATWVNNPGRPGGRAALSVPRGPSNRAANPPWDATQP